MASKIIISKFKIFLERLPRIFAEKAFLVCLLLFLSALVMGFFLFYKYNFLAKTAEPNIADSEFRFEEKKYQNILKIWQEKEEEFNATGTRQYSDPFYGR